MNRNILPAVTNSSDWILKNNIWIKKYNDDIHEYILKSIKKINLLIKKNKLNDNKKSILNKKIYTNKYFIEIIDNTHYKFINPFNYEVFEQQLIYKYVKKNDIVLEIGGRLGIVSYTINSILNEKTNHVVIEPNKNSIGSLIYNKLLFDSKYIICNKVLSNIPLKLINTNDTIGSYTERTNNKNEDISIKLMDFIKIYNNNFTALIADCEGCLVDLIVKDNLLNYFPNLKLIIFEKDRLNELEYNKIYKILKQKNFRKIDSLLNNFQQVWKLFLNNKN
jgi:hypothetical protein